MIRMVFVINLEIDSIVVNTVVSQMYKKLDNGYENRMKNPTFTVVLTD